MEVFAKDQALTLKEKVFSFLKNRRAALVGLAVILLSLLVVVFLG